jgi:hypothetical protein
MRLNGWQRLWLVGTVCLGLWLMGLEPLKWAAENDSQRSYRRALEKDFRNPQCRPYQTEGGACWHIYTSRQYNAEVPYTLETYNEPVTISGGDSILKFSPLGLVQLFFSAPSLMFAGGWLAGFIEAFGGRDAQIGARY